MAPRVILTKRLTTFFPCGVRTTQGPMVGYTVQLFLQISLYLVEGIRQITGGWLEGGNTLQCLYGIELDPGHLLSLATDLPDFYQNPDIYSFCLSLGFM